MGDTGHCQSLSCPGTLSHGTAPPVRAARRLWPTQVTSVGQGSSPSWALCCRRLVTHRPAMRHHALCHLVCCGVSQVHSFISFQVEFIKGLRTHLPCGVANRDWRGQCVGAAWAKATGSGTGQVNRRFCLLGGTSRKQAQHIMTIGPTAYQALSRYQLLALQGGRNKSSALRQACSVRRH